MTKKPDARKRFLKLAYDQLNPDLTTVEGLQTALINWYCFQYNVPPNDDKLQELCLEELLVLNQMHKLRENPNLAEEIGSNSDDYEDWLKGQMGDEYVNPEDMIKTAEDLEESERREVLEKYPDKVTTDFSKISGD